jgi:hypothetical protein
MSKKTAEDRAAIKAALMDKIAASRTKAQQAREHADALTASRQKERPDAV